MSFFLENMLTERDKEAWRQCLILWEAIASIPSFNTRDGNGNWDGKISVTFKGSVLERLGFDSDIRNACPFCECYSDGSSVFFIDCTECPISKVVFRNSYNCLGTPYRMWEHMFDDNHFHDRNAAEEFYKFLVKLAKSVGYEPDFTLKFWSD